ncbi:hypothetical protein VTH06DRAFT_6170 [Thermothelomyces fergusii]
MGRKKGSRSIVPPGFEPTPNPSKQCRALPCPVGKARNRFGLTDPPGQRQSIDAGRRRILGREFRMRRRLRNLARLGLACRLSRTASRATSDDPDPAIQQLHDLHDRPR